MDVTGLGQLELVRLLSAPSARPTYDEQPHQRCVPPLVSAHTRGQPLVLGWLNRLAPSPRPPPSPPSPPAVPAGGHGFVILAGAPRDRRPFPYLGGEGGDEPQGCLFPPGGTAVRLDGPATAEALSALPAWTSLAAVPAPPLTGAHSAPDGRGRPDPRPPAEPRHGPDPDTTGALLGQVPGREIPGFRLTVPREFDSNIEDPPASHDAVGPPSLPIGVVLDGWGRPSGDFAVSVDALNRHMFVCGATGSGKSQTVRQLLEPLGRTPEPLLPVVDRDPGGVEEARAGHRHLDPARGRRPLDQEEQQPEQAEPDEQDGQDDRPRRDAGPRGHVILHGPRGGAQRTRPRRRGDLVDGHRDVAQHGKCRRLAAGRKAAGREAARCAGRRDRMLLPCRAHCRGTLLPLATRRTVSAPL